MAFTVLYDSNVLYPNTVRDLLIRLARHGIVQAKWTERILDEVQEAHCGATTSATRRSAPSFGAA